MSTRSRYVPVRPLVMGQGKGLPIWPAASIGILIVLAILLPPGLVSGMNVYMLLLSLIAWIASGERFDRNLFKAISPFALLIVIGMMTGIGADNYLYMKDVWYVGNPAVVITAGYVFYRCKPDLGRGLRAFVLGGTVAAIFYMVPIFYRPTLITESAIEMRNVLGTGYYAPVLAASILIAYRGRCASALKLPSWIAGTCFVICVASMLLTASRTILIVGCISTLCGLGFFSRREWLRVGAIVVVAALGLAVLQANIDEGSREVRQSFVGKLARSMDEIKVEEYLDEKSINESYRGFETARALRLYESGSTIQLLFGQGFGAQVDLGTYLNLTGIRGDGLRFIPVFHNGYIYLLIKTGAVGVVLFLLALVWLYSLGRRRAASSGDDPHTGASRVLQAAVLSLALTTWFVAGAFNKLDMFSFLLISGFSIAALTRPSTEKS